MLKKFWYNDISSTATQLGSGVLVSGSYFYSPFAIANGVNYFPGPQAVENFVAISAIAALLEWIKVGNAPSIPDIFDYLV